jgi:hypothetical protein
MVINLRDERRAALAEVPPAINWGGTDWQEVELQAPQVEVLGVISERKQRVLRAMILPDHLEAKRRAPLEARAAERRAAQQRAAESSAKVDMRVPVYFDELAVGLRLAVYGEGDNLVQAMCVHNGHLHKHGALGKIETGQ